MLMLLIFLVMIVTYYYNVQSPTELLKPYNIDILINKAPMIESDNQQLVSYFFEQFKSYIYDLHEEGKINDQRYSALISSFYGANNIFKFLVNGGIIDWDEFLFKYFYPLPPTSTN